METQKPLASMDERLQSMKELIDELQEKLDKIDNHRNDLKPMVKQYNELSRERKEVKSTLNQETKKMNIILDFFKASTGEESYGLFPLFSQQNTEFQQQAN